MALTLTPACVGSYGFSDGSVSLPSIFFTGDRDTGLYRSGVAMYVAVNGTTSAYFSSTGTFSTNIIKSLGTSSLVIKGGQADGATAVGCKSGNNDALTTAGSTIHNFYSDNVTTLRAYIDRLGRFSTTQNSTGAGAALLGANCPAGTVANPYTWLHFIAADGTLVYVPAWA